MTHKADVSLSYHNHTLTLVALWHSPSIYAFTISLVTAYCQRVTLSRYFPGTKKYYSDADASACWSGHVNAYVRRTMRAFVRGKNPMQKWLKGTVIMYLRSRATARVRGAPSRSGRGAAARGSRARLQQRPGWRRPTHTTPRRPILRPQLTSKSGRTDTRKPSGNTNRVY